MKKSVYIIIIILICIPILLYYIPIKFSTTVEAFCKKFSEIGDQVILICYPVQTTGGDWHVEQVIRGNTAGIIENQFQQSIEIKGEHPIRNVKLPGTIAVFASYIFVGKFENSHYMEDETPIFTADNWGILAPIESRDIIGTPSNYLNIYNYFNIID